MIKILLAILLSVGACAFDVVSYEKAFALSKKEDKPVLLVVYKDGCPACKLLFTRMNKSPVVDSVLQDYVVSVISVDEAFSKYGTEVKVTPTVFILNSKKEELMDPLPGTPQDNIEFVDYLQMGKVIFSKKE